MKRDLECLTQEGTCRYESCGFSQRNTQHIQHVQVHYIIFIMFGYFSKYRGTTTKHGRQKHPYEMMLVTQADKEQVAGLLETVPTLPIIKDKQLGSRRL